METSCDFEFMEYLDENSVDANLMCSICQKPFNEPMCTSCDHTFGRGCITQWLAINEVHSCPICIKQPLLVKDLVPASRPLRNMLDQLRVRCTLCEQTGLQRGNFLDHINKVCPKAMVPCQAADIKCAWKGPRDELHKHMATCVFEPLRPVLASLIGENRQLMTQVQKHDNEIKNLTAKMSKMTGTATNNSDDDSDVSSVSEYSVGGSNQMEEDAIFVRNLPCTVKFNDLFDLFSKIGPIKYDRTNQKAGVFIFRNPNNKNGPGTAKVIYVDNKSASAAVAEYNDKHIPQWNARLQVCISKPKRGGFKDFGKDNKDKRTSAPQEVAAMASGAKALDKVTNLLDLDDLSQEPSGQNMRPINNNTRPRAPRPKRENKSTNYKTTQ